MTSETVALATPFVVGALVLSFTLVEVRSLFRLLDGRRYRQYWAAAGILIALFFVGYLLAAGLLLVGSQSLLVSITGAFALLGAVFAFLVVTVGERTIDDLVRSRDELERREEEFERLYEVTDVLNRILRHNLRNNMNVILGRSDMLHDDSTESEHVDAIQAEAQKLVEIGEKARAIHDTLDAEVSADVRPVETFVSPVVADVREEYPNATVTVDAEEDLWVEAGALVETAVENVLDNAIRHNEGAASVTISIVATADDFVAVSVADDGPGIDPYEIQAIREQRETPLQHGSGLGLWLSSWIVDQYDGGISFEDNDPTGSVVTLTLPRAQPPSPDGVEARQDDQADAQSASD
ncbi:PAS domain-containing protein [Salinarchaeum sp. Harcht-Bsk1]|nr:PAS domain-containing protein [Salinarchaeum sp. Harcht-Bsk1]